MGDLPWDAAKLLQGLARKDGGLHCIGAAREGGQTFGERVQRTEDGMRM